jgi:hypothetical protein
VLKEQRRSYRSHQKEQTALFKKLQRQQMVPMPLQLQHQGQQQQLQEIQLNQLDKPKEGKGKAEAALFFDPTPTEMDCLNALSLFHPL